MVKPQRRATKTAAKKSPAMIDLCGQNDLYNGSQIVDFWTALVDGPRAAVRVPRAS